MDRSRRVGIALVLGAATLWGTTGTAQWLAPHGAAPPSVGAVRLVLGGAVLLGVFSARGALPPPRAWVNFPFAVAAASLAAYQVLFFSGVARAGVALGTLVGIGSAPILSGALAFLVLRERPERGWAVATVLAVAGCALLLGGPVPVGDANTDALGLLLAVGAGGAYAVYVLATKRLLDRGWRPEQVAGAGLGVAGLLLAPFLLVYDASWIVSGRGALVAVHLGLLTIGLAYFLFTRGLQRIPGPTAVTLTLAEPLTAAILGLVVVGERLGGVGFAGAGLIVLGLLHLTAFSRGGRRGRA